MNLKERIRMAHIRAHWDYTGIMGQLYVARGISTEELAADNAEGEASLADGYDAWIGVPIYSTADYPDRPRLNVVFKRIGWDRDEYPEVY